MSQIEREAFIDTIREAPGDDTPRLVFADWLEDHGEPDRAAFVRVQCELERCDPASDRGIELRRRSVEMQAAHERDWLGEWSDRLVRWRFRRGFLERAVFTAGPFVAAGAELFRREPLREAAFVNAEGEPVEEESVPELVACPHFAYVQALNATACDEDEPHYGMYGGAHPGPAWLRALAGAGHVTRLEELKFGGGLRGGGPVLEIEAFRAFCGAAHLRSVRALDFSDVYDSFGIGDEVVEALAAATFAGRITSLNLSQFRLTDHSAGLIASSPVFAALQRLDVASCADFTREGLRRIFQSRTLTRLTDLAFDTRADLRDLSPSLLSRLTAMRVSQGYRLEVGEDRNLGEPVYSRCRTGLIDWKQWEALASSPDFRLTRLDLGRGGCLDEFLPLLLGRLPLGGLKSLAIGTSCYHSLDHFLQEFPVATWPFPALRELHVGPVQSLEALRALSAWAGLQGLDSLTIDTPSARELAAILELWCFPACLTHLTAHNYASQGPRPLLTATALRWLTSLQTYPALMTPDVMTALRRSPVLQNLDSLYLWSFGERGDVGMALANTPGLPRLRNLVIGSDTDADVVAALRRRWGPRLRVCSDY